MTIYSTLLLATGLMFSVVACADNDSKTSCTAPAPFKLLDKADADKYPLSAILSKSHSPYPTLPNEKTKNTQMVNFWAAWCTPCRQELPLLEKIAIEKTAKVTLINVGDKQAMAEKILAELAIKQLKTRLADSSILSDFSIMGLPASLVFHDDHVYLGMGKLKDEVAITKWLNCLSN